MLDCIFYDACRARNIFVRAVGAATDKARRNSIVVAFGLRFSTELRNRTHEVWRVRSNDLRFEFRKIDFYDFVLVFLRIFFAFGICMKML